MAWASRSSTEGTENVQQIANLLLLRGNFGKPGAGICPLRGHSNVQGDRTVGINERPPEALLDGIERAFGFKPPQHHGHDAVAALEAMVEGRSKVLICLGGNLAVAMPDPEMCYKAMRNLDLAVHILTKLNRSALLIGKESIILPCLGRTEEDIQATGPQFVTVEDSMSMVHASKGNLPPASESSALRAGDRRGHRRCHAAEQQGPLACIWSPITTGSAMRIEAVFPDFKDYNKRVRVPGGFRLPLPPPSGFGRRRRARPSS